MNSWGYEHQYEDFSNKRVTKFKEERLSFLVLQTTKGEKICKTMVGLTRFRIIPWFEEKHRLTSWIVHVYSRGNRWSLCKGLGGHLRTLTHIMTNFYIWYKNGYICNGYYVKYLIRVFPLILLIILPCQYCYVTLFSTHLHQREGEIKTSWKPETSWRPLTLGSFSLSFWNLFPSPHITSYITSVTGKSF